MFGYKLSKIKSLFSKMKSFKKARSIVLSEQVTSIQTKRRKIQRKTWLIKNLLLWKSLNSTSKFKKDQAALFSKAKEMVQKFFLV